MPSAIAALAMPVRVLQRTQPLDVICVLVDYKDKLSQDGNIQIGFARGRLKERPALQLHDLALLRPLRPLRRLTGRATLYMVDGEVGLEVVFRVGSERTAVILV